MRKHVYDLAWHRVAQRAGVAKYVNDEVGDQVFVQVRDNTCVPVMRRVGDQVRHQAWAEVKRRLVDGSWR